MKTPVLLALASLVLATTASSATEPDETIELPKLAVRGVAVCSYGIAIGGFRDPATKRVKRLFITAVSEESAAERAGLHAGDEIIGINGVKVGGMDGLMKPGAPLFDLLINQPDGRPIELEVILHATKTMTLKAGQ